MTSLRPTQLTCQTFIVCGVISGIFIVPTMTLPDVFLLVAIWQIFVIFGQSIAFHRIAAHNFEPKSKLFYFFCTIVGTLNGFGSLLVFKALHLKHHAESDSKLDPHSPSHKNIFWLIFCKPYQTIDQKFLLRIFKKLHNNDWLLILHNYYWGVNILYSVVIGLLFGLKYVFLLHIIPATLAGLTITIFVDVLGHSKFNLGYRTFNIADNSVNNRWTMLITGGESLHNNHHAYPSKINYGMSDGEFDISYFILRICRQV